MYIPTFGLFNEAEFPKLISPSFIVLYKRPFFETFANIPTFLSPVLVILAEVVFLNVTVPDIFPGS